MRILKLCHEYPPVGGGAAAVCAALAREYVRQGHSVDVVTMGFARLPSQETDGGSVVCRVACGRRRKEMASPLEGLVWAERAKSLVRRMHAVAPYDAIHAHFLMPAGITAAWARQQLGIPAIVTPHGSDVPGYNRERLKVAHRLAGPWWRRICGSVDRIVSPSHDLLALLRRSCRADHAEVIPNGFQPGRLRPLEKRQRILLCSRLVERKGFHRFLEAIADDGLDGWEIDIVGDGPMRSRIEQLAKQARSKVNVRGWLDNDSRELAELYGHASIFVLPSERENFSIALLEAMSAGCAVVTTDVAGNPEVIGDCGVLVPLGDAAALRRAVLELTSDPGRRAALGDAGRVRALERFTWSALGRQYADLLSALRTEAAGPGARAT